MRSAANSDFYSEADSKAIANVVVQSYHKLSMKLNRILICLTLISAFLFSSFLAASVLFAGPPFVTDDPETLEHNHWEIYLAAQFNYAKSEISGYAPQLDLNYGLLPDVQLNIVMPVSYLQTRGKKIDLPFTAPIDNLRTRWSRPRFGYGNTEIALKVRFLHETDKIPQITIYPRIIAPTEDKRVGYTNLPQAYLPLLLQKSWERLTTYGGGGFIYHPGKDNKNYWFAGWLLQYKITDIFSLGGEIFYYSPDSRNENHRVSANLGMVIDISENWHLLFSAGRDIKGPNLVYSYLSIQFTI
jgi:hypothetical protein